jgi:hypothetical protein
MEHPLRTLLYDLFAEPPLRLLQRTLDLSVSSTDFLVAHIFHRKSQQEHKVPITLK